MQDSPKNLVALYNELHPLSRLQFDHEYKKAKGGGFCLSSGCFFKAETVDGYCWGCGQEHEAKLKQDFCDDLMRGLEHDERKEAHQ